MSNEKKYLYRILLGIFLYLSNNEFTWKIINYFASFSEGIGKILSISNAVLVIVSLSGIIITFLNVILLFILTLKREKNSWNAYEITTYK